MGRKKKVEKVFPIEPSLRRFLWRIAFLAGMRAVGAVPKRGPENIGVFDPKPVQYWLPGSPWHGLINEVWPQWKAGDPTQDALASLTQWLVRWGVNVPWVKEGVESALRFWASQGEVGPWVCPPPPREEVPEEVYAQWQDDVAPFLKDLTAVDIYEQLLFLESMYLHRPFTFEYEFKVVWMWRWGQTLEQVRELAKQELRYVEEKINETIENWGKMAKEHDLLPQKDPAHVPLEAFVRYWFFGESPAMLALRLDRPRSEWNEPSRVKKGLAMWRHRLDLPRRRPKPFKAPNKA